MSGPRPYPLWSEISAEKFGHLAGHLTWAPGRVRYTESALRALPGKKIRWAIGSGPKRARMMLRAAARTDPGDLIIVVNDLAEADSWYFALLAAEGCRKPWLKRRRRG
jgi:hypothetical protein